MAVPMTVLRAASEEETHMAVKENAPLILVVDDEDGVADLLVDALTLGGYRARRARDGQEALRVLREISPDVILLDVNMPGLNGFEVLERIRAKGDETPVLFLTARQDRQDTGQSDADRPRPHLPAFQLRAVTRCLQGHGRVPRRRRAHLP